jgi:hypothetical protein
MHSANQNPKEIRTLPSENDLASNRRILLIGLLHASLWWLLVFRLQHVLQWNYCLGQQCLLVFGLSQLTVMSLLFSERRTPRFWDHFRMYVNVGLYASGPAPAIALSMGAPYKMPLRDQFLYFVFVGLAVWAVLIAVCCFVYLVQRLSIVTCQAGIRILFGGMKLRDKENQDSYSLSTVLLGTVLFAICFAVVTSPYLSSSDLALRRSDVLQLIVVSFLPLIMTWCIWATAMRMRSIRMGVLFHLGLLSVSLTMAYHFATYSFLFQSRGLPVLFQDQFVSGWEKVLAVFLLIGSSSIVVQLTIFACCLPVHLNRFKQYCARSPEAGSLTGT